MIGYHALPGLPAVYHQVAALALVDAVRAYEFINVHVFHGPFLSHGRKAAGFFKGRRQMEKSAAPGEKVVFLRVQFIVAGLIPGDNGDQHGKKDKCCDNKHIFSPSVIR